MAKWNSWDQRVLTTRQMIREHGFSACASKIEILSYKDQACFELARRLETEDALTSLKVKYDALVGNWEQEQGAVEQWRAKSERDIVKGA